MSFPCRCQRGLPQVASSTTLHSVPHGATSRLQWHGISPVPRLGIRRNSFQTAASPEGKSSASFLSIPLEVGLRLACSWHAQLQKLAGHGCNGGCHQEQMRTLLNKHVVLSADLWHALYWITFAQPRTFVKGWNCFTQWVFDLYLPKRTFDVF